MNETARKYWEAKRDYAYAKLQTARGTATLKKWNYEYKNACAALRPPVGKCEVQSVG